METMILYPKGFRQLPQNVPDCSLCHIRLALKSSWKTIHPCLRNVSNRHAASPSLGTAKQSIQAWNSLTNHYWCHDQHISKIPCIQGDKCNIPWMLHIIPCVIMKIYSPVFFSVMLLAGTPPPHKNPRVNVNRLVWVSCSTFPEKFIKFSSRFFP